MILNETANTKEVLAFIEKRRSGAKKIAEEASGKSGPPKLTEYHFRRKIQCYDEATKIVRSGGGEKDMERRFKGALVRISAHQTQKKFQEDMGEVEVFGELLIFMKKGDVD